MTPIALFERANNLPIIYTPSHHRAQLRKVCDARQNGQKVSHNKTWNNYRIPQWE